MEITSGYLAKFNIKNFSKEQALAEDIYLYFGKKLPFGRIMKMIKMKGYQAIYEFFEEIKRSNPKDRLSLFIYKVKNNKVVFAENEKATSL